MNNSIAKNNQYDGLMIKHDNKLSRSICIANLQQKKLIYLVFAEFFRNNHGIMVDISKNEFFDKLNIKSNNKYIRYKKICESVIDKKFWVDMKGSFIISPISYIWWHDSEQHFTVKINPDFLVFLKKASNFTYFALDELVKLKSDYSWTLFVYLLSFRYPGEKKCCYITLENLKRLFKLNKTDYVYNNKFQTKLFETKTVIKALKEINSLSGFDVNYKITTNAKYKYRYDFEINST